METPGLERLALSLLLPSSFLNPEGGIVAKERAGMTPAMGAALGGCSNGLGQPYLTVQAVSSQRSLALNYPGAPPRRQLKTLKRFQCVSFGLACSNP